MPSLTLVYFSHFAAASWRSQDSYTNPMASSLGGWKNPLRPHGGLSTERWQMRCFHLFLRQMASLVPRIAKAANAEAITPISWCEISNFCNYDWGIKLPSNFAVYSYSLSFSWKFFTNNLWNCTGQLIIGRSTPCTEHYDFSEFFQDIILHLGLTWLRNNGPKQAHSGQNVTSKTTKLALRWFPLCYSKSTKCQLCCRSRMVIWLFLTRLVANFRVPLSHQRDTSIAWKLVL